MKFRSTRRKSPALGFSGALAQSLAPDGGLYVPETWPAFRPEDFDGLTIFPDIAQRVLAPFFQGDPLSSELTWICRAAVNFPVPLMDLERQTSVLELFHGPTAAFKDVGARFLAECLSRKEGKRTILVATSGDTGGAVAGAFHGREGFEAVILYPKGKVSPRQEKQLTSWGGNVRAYAVRGDFDDCQRMVKEAFADQALRARTSLVSANSINIARLLPQAAYSAAASLWYLRRHGVAPGFIVPSGNLGNAVGTLWAKRLGFPIREVVLATNANRAVPDYLSTGVWKPANTVATLANAMDVGNPSNMERLRDLYPRIEDLRRDVSSASVSDTQIRETISKGPSEWHQEWCPHTATAVHAREQLGSPHWIVVATAHPAKFDTIVEPLLGKKVALPPALSAILARPSQMTEIDAQTGALLAVL